MREQRRGGTQRSPRTEHGPATGPEMFDRDATGALTPVTGAAAGASAGGTGGAGGRVVGLALPGAVLGVLLVGSIAFGAGAMGFIRAGGTADEDVAPGLVLADGASGGDAASANGGTGAGADATTSGAGADGGVEPGTVQVANQETPTDEATGEPPVTTETIKLEATWSDGKVRVDWTACDPEGFAYWKVVRSTDETVTWPLGANDTLVAAIEDPAKTAFGDAKALAGRHWYRVFALAEADGGLVVACASNVDGAKVPADPEPTGKPTEKPTAEPTEKPEPTDEPEPTEKPEPMGLTVSLKEGHPLVDWSACTSERFDWYKVVRSKDEKVTWPLGDYDALVGAIDDQGTTKLWDTDAPAGRTLYYRVFCLDKTADGYKVLNATGVDAVKTPEPEPAPDPVSLSIEAVVDGGAVHLSWETCTSESFVYYKVVRATHDNPSYKPWTDGTELIAVIENSGVDGLVDEHVESGQTWFYRVQAIGTWNGTKVVLGQTPAIEVTIP